MSKTRRNSLAKHPRRVYSASAMKNHHTIRSFRDLLEVEWPSGTGRRGLAAWAGVSLTGLANWGEYVPPGYHYRLHLWLTSEGYELDPITFGLGRDGFPAARPRRASTRQAARATA